MGKAEVEAFLTHLAVEKNVSASTQNQALAALLFLYRDVLSVDLAWLDGFLPAKKSSRVPVVLTKDEVKLILSHLTDTNWLIANLLYGSGLRLIEALRLRVKDLDFGYRQITVRDGKGGKDRFTVLPTKLIEPLKVQLLTVEKLHGQDLRRGLGRVVMPFALANKYRNAEAEFAWQFVFPAKSLSKNPRTGKTGRHHASPSSLQKPFREALRKCRINKNASPHTLRHSFAKQRVNGFASGFAEVFQEITDVWIISRWNFAADQGKTRGKAAQFYFKTFETIKDFFATIQGLVKVIYCVIHYCLECAKVIKHHIILSCSGFIFCVAQPEFH